MLSLFGVNWFTGLFIDWVISLIVYWVNGFPGIAWYVEMCEGGWDTGRRLRIENELFS